MFTDRYFAPRYFPNSYFAPGLAAEAVTTPGIPIGFSGASGHDRASSTWTRWDGEDEDRPKKKHTKTPDRIDLSRLPKPNDQTLLDVLKMRDPYYAEMPPISAAHIERMKREEDDIAALLLMLP